MKVPSQQVKKLDNRSKPLVNLGKEAGTKAYRLYDPESDKVCVSRDVIFEGEKSWPWDQFDNDGAIQHGAFSLDWELGTGETPRAEFHQEHSNSDQEHSNSETEGQGGSPYIQSGTKLDRENYDDSGVPKKSRSIFDIYENTE